jgi:hypothetical protein
MEPDKSLRSKEGHFIHAVCITFIVLCLYSESNVSLYYVVCKMLSSFALKFLIVSSENGKDIKPKTLSQYRKAYISVWTHLGRKCIAKSNNTQADIYLQFLTAWIFETLAVHVLYFL